MAEPTYHGSIVAFEGNSETIATQLRLLPKAPQILVLPPVEAYLPKGRRKRPFEARSHIKQIHEAAESRLAAAKEFLKDSTPEHKKLVFLHGGTVKAQALCIATIRDSQTATHLDRADSIFNQLVKDGVAGLEERAELRRSRLLGFESDVAASTDPIIRAMRAAELLDCETASLQPSTEIDLTSCSRKRRRSLSLPVYRYSEHMEGALPFYVFGAQQEWDSASKRSSKQTYRDDSSTRSPLPVLDEHTRHGTFLFPPKSPSCVGEAYRRQSIASIATTELLSPRSEALPMSRPETPDPVVYGEACAVRLRSQSLRKARTRSTSLDRATIKRISYAETVSDCRSPSKASTEFEFNYAISPYLSGGMETPRSRNTLTDQPKTVFIRNRRSSQKTVDIPKWKFTNSRSSYVDRGTDAEYEEDISFRPVLPVTEDLIVYFSEREQDGVLDHVLQSFKDGLYPVQRSPSTSEVDEHVPTTPTSHHPCIPELEKFRWESRPSVEITTAPSSSHDNYDPYAADQYEIKTWVQPHAFKPVSARHTAKPPTPDSTPAPSINIGFEKKLHEFNTLNCATAVSMQNSLRSVLNLYFPPEETGYHQCSFPLLPESDGLWQPIFRETEGISSQGKNRVDQIIAIGSQKGVKKDFVSTISGQLGMLGSKQSGINRSGKLDLRYLIASAMQVFTAQPLANQTQDNPFTNPYLLATLIIPHLETYLAMNPNIRFLLLEYPPEHLSTALALQRLVGVGLLKVAGIIRADRDTRVARGATSQGFDEGLAAISLAKSSRPRATSPSSSKPSSPASTSSFSGSLHLSFSKANFLLASSASDKEISEFIHTIWKVLTETSSYYSIDELPIEARGFLMPSRPARELLSPPSSASLRRPTSSRSNEYQPKGDEPHRTPPSNLLPPPASPRMGSQNRPTTPLSEGTSVHSSKSLHSGRTQRDRIKNLLGSSPPSSWTERGGLRGAMSIRSGKSGRSAAIVDDDGASSFFDFTEDDKFDLEDEERRLMPLFEKRRNQQRGSVNGGAKALKWLGIT